MGDCSPFITHCPCCSFHLRAKTPHILSLIQCRTVLHELLQCESFLWAAALCIFYSMYPFHRLQSFRSTLFQHRSPAASQFLPGNLFQCGFLSPWVHRYCKDPAPACPSHRVTASFRHLSPLAWGVLSVRLDTA